MKEDAGITTTRSQYAVNTAQHVVLQHSFLSCVNSNSLLNVGFSMERSILMSILLMSGRIICIQVVFDLLRGLFTSLRYSSRAFLAGVSESSLIRCPNHISLLALITWLHMVANIIYCIQQNYKTGESKHVKTLLNKIDA